MMEVIGKVLMEKISRAEKKVYGTKKGGF